VGQLDSDTFGLSRMLTVPQLALARSIAPDGAISEVRHEDAIIQRSGRSSSDIYDDNEEIVIIFRDIDAGDPNQMIVAFEDRERRLDGEFSLLWFGGWAGGRAGGRGVDRRVPIRCQA